MVSSFVLSIFLMAAVSSYADTAGRPDDGTPDEVYEELIGPAYGEKEGGDGLVAGGAASFSVSAETTYQWPVQLHNWTIYSWYPANDGFRFYGIYYKNELVLYDYRIPWVRINGNLRVLTIPNLVQGPDMWVYNSGYFLVKARYNLGNPNVDVTIMTRFYSNGNVEPWVLVDTHNVQMSVKVGQRFDFDLGDTDDDNQQYYNGVLWSAPGVENFVLDSSYQSNSSGWEWRDFDTDLSGNGYVVDQEVAVKPYSSDDSKWYMLRYAGGEIANDPGGFLNSQSINLYIANQADPWIGYDAVNWYVSNYPATTLAYPGPWLKVMV